MWRCPETVSGRRFVAWGGVGMFCIWRCPTVSSKGFGCCHLVIYFGGGGRGGELGAKRLEENGAGGEWRVLHSVVLVMSGRYRLGN